MKRSVRTTVIAGNWKMNKTPKEAKGSPVKVGAENVHWAESGAFTGEISAAMLKEIGVEYVIIGHSERRQYFGETDQTVNARVKAALSAGLKVILCVGELLAEREEGVTAEVVSRQVKIDLLGVTKEQMANVIIAYEPVWAIGTGKTATSDQAKCWASSTPKSSPKPPLSSTAAA